MNQNNLYDYKILKNCEIQQKLLYYNVSDTDFCIKGKKIYTRRLIYHKLVYISFILEITHWNKLYASHKF